jgi:Domain of unknown function (DUF4440)
LRHSAWHWALLIGLAVVLRMSPAVVAQEATIPIELKKTMDSIDAARAAGDGSRWSSFAAEEYVVTHPDGRVHHRSEEAAEITAAGPAASAFTREAVRLHRYGDHIIIITSRFYGRSGQASQASDVWVRQGGRWMIAAAQLTPISSH